jgi:hypothetical protein
MFPIIPANSVTAASGNDEGIFCYGYDGVAPFYSTSNLVSNTGVVSSDVAGVGTAKMFPAGCEYGGDKGIFGFGATHYILGTRVNTSNLVSNTGVVSSDVAGVGTARKGLGACRYGGDKGIFGFGGYGGPVLFALTNLVSNAGVVATDTVGVGTARYMVAACEYGGDKGIFGFGTTPNTAITNLVSNAGVVATDTVGVGTARYQLAACGYGGDKGIFGYGEKGGGQHGGSNLVSNTGVVSTDVADVGTTRSLLAACDYGGDKGIFGYGATWVATLSITNLVSNTGVVASDQAATTGTARNSLAACSFN